MRTVAGAEQGRFGAIVADEEDERVGVEAGLLERVEQAADVVIEETMMAAPRWRTPLRCATRARSCVRATC